MSYIHTYTQFDADHNGHITVAEIGDVLKALGESVPGYKIRDMVKEVDLDENGTVEFDEFLAVKLSLFLSLSLSLDLSILFCNISKY